MKILIAPDSFKGSLTAAQAAAAIQEGIRKSMPEAELILLPMADGGEGTVEVLVNSQGGTMYSSVVQGPLGEPVTAQYGILADGTTGVLEMASASGLNRIPSHKRNPLAASTYGTGEIMKNILDRGCRTMIIGIGGSATNDGGMGMAAALGIRFSDKQGNEVPPGGGNLHRIDSISLTHKDPRLDEAEILVACDVNNPLLGPQGASHIYGPQKGATPAMVQELEQNMVHFNEQLIRHLGLDMADRPGAGAAGGLGAGLMAFAGGRIVSGVELIMDTVHMDQLLDECQLVCTGEGRLDLQTLSGKVIAGIARRASAKKKTVIVFCGEWTGEEFPADEFPIIPFSIASGPGSLEHMMDDAYRLLSKTSQHVFQLIHRIERGWSNV